MQYRINPKNGDRLSALGFGCMRFGKDIADTRAQILRAVESGVNFFDTAYVYPGSEATLGRILQEEGLRDRVYLSTKLPPYLVRRAADIDKLFKTQLERLRTDRIDYYFIHMLPGCSEWERLKGLGIEEWIAKAKASGQIGNIGFSYHGGVQEYKALVDAYDWDFSMIQYNYLDEHRQAGREGLQYAADKGLMMMVMEPLRGGRLAQLPAGIRGLVSQGTPAQWALRWVWNHPQVSVLLSGMNSLEMVDENVATASQALPCALTGDELAMIDSLRAGLQSDIRVGCTGCNYCLPCPAGVDIPLCFSIYNDAAHKGALSALIDYTTRANRHMASQCVGCGRCVQHCPQGIAIPDELQNVARALEKTWQAPIRFVIRKVMKMS